MLDGCIRNLADDILDLVHAVADLPEIPKNRFIDQDPWNVLSSSVRSVSRSFFQLITRALT